MIATDGLASSMVVWPGLAGCLSGVSGHASFFCGNPRVNGCIDIGWLLGETTTDEPLNVREPRQQLVPDTITAAVPNRHQSLP